MQAPEPAVDTAKLEALAHGPEPAPAPKVETPPPADLEQANQKLAVLLGGKGPGAPAK